MTLIIRRLNRAALKSFTSPDAGARDEFMAQPDDAVNRPPNL
ncbi:hypothetical protein [Acetobacter sacchari]|nr:hypothetical protein [Acetobacter sacchari]